MRASRAGLWAATLVLFVAGCGGRPTPAEPGSEGPTRPAPGAGTRQVTIHVKDMT
jgi:hypothetical protein